MNHTYDIFVSYRREGGEALACLLTEKLRQLGYTVFYDVESLRSGKFNNKLLDIIDECNDVLVVLPQHALDRCINPDDWVRKELAQSLKANKNIVPIMMRNFEWPLNLPDDLKELANYNGVSANMEYFDATFEKILSMLKSAKNRLLINDEFNLVYYSFAPYVKDRLVISKLIFDGNAHVNLLSNLKSDGSYEYQYHGTALETESNIYISLSNDISTEKVNITLLKSAGNLGRYIGLLNALSPTMIPVCFKCVCVRTNDFDKINKDMLKMVLHHDNKEWNQDLMTIESMQVNMFYSDYFFGTP